MVLQLLGNPTTRNGDVQFARRELYGTDDPSSTRRFGRKVLSNTRLPASDNPVLGTWPHRVGKVMVVLRDITPGTINNLSNTYYMKSRA